jgi:hypothetical protein
MRASLVAVITCLVALTGARAAEEPARDGPAPKVITVDAASQARFGVSVVSLAAAALPSIAPATARVLDPSTLLQLDKDLATASAGFTAARDNDAQVKKAYSEGRTASRRDVQAAHEQEVVALQKVNAARRQLAMEWGGGIADLQAHSRAELLSDISGANVELVRVELPAGLATPRVGAALQIHGYSEADTFAGTVMGVLPLVDQRMETRGLLLKLKGDAAKLPIGQTLTAEVPVSGGSSQLGVILPRASLLRHDSRVWVYLQTGAESFVRKEVPEYRPVPNGWFVSRGFAPGDHVVAAGATALLGVEAPETVGSN